jgi:2-polyprenyl-6-methoxyphenol hydroxylase-like FAD-dependent oxidoreductase
VKEDLDIWAIFDLGDHPPPNYARDRVCLLGDAAVSLRNRSSGFERLD